MIRGAILAAVAVLGTDATVINTAAGVEIENTQRHLLQKKKGKKTGGAKNKKKKGGKGGKGGKKKKKAGKSANSNAAVPEGYQKCAGINIPGHNDVEIKDATVNQCAAECTSMGDNCLSFDWKDLDSGTSCALTVSTGPKAPYTGGDLYVKSDAVQAKAEEGELCGPRACGVKCKKTLSCVDGFGESGEFSICINEAVEEETVEDVIGARIGEECVMQGTQEEMCVEGLMCEGGYGENGDISICTVPKPEGYEFTAGTVMVVPEDAEVLQDVAQPHICAFFCLTKGPDCMGFNFYQEEEYCVLSKSLEAATTPSTTGDMYTKLNLVSQFGEPCDGIQIVCDDDFVCTDGFGDTGKWYMCAWPVPDGYQVLRSHNIPGENMYSVSITKPGVQECADACDADPACVTFDYKAQEDRCSISSASTGWETYPGDLFFKMSAIEGR